MNWGEMTESERNALVAEKVMGWKVGEHPELHGTGQMMVEYEEPVYFKPDGSFLCECEWEPSTDIAAAWEVVDKFPLFRVERVEIYVGHKHTKTTCWTDVEKEPLYAECAGAPEAICLAALRAVGVKV